MDSLVWTHYRNDGCATGQNAQCPLLILVLECIAESRSTDGDCGAIEIDLPTLLLLLFWCDRNMLCTAAIDDSLNECSESSSGAARGFWDWRFLYWRTELQGWCLAQFRQFLSSSACQSRV